MVLDPTIYCIYDLIWLNTNVFTIEKPSDKKPEVKLSFTFCFTMYKLSPNISHSKMTYL